MSGIDTHAHVFRRDLPFVNNRRYSPDYDATVETYINHLDTHELSHGVLVQPSFLGTDNSFMISVLKHYMSRLRGIAVVDSYMSEDQLNELSRVGIVGIRLNLVGKSVLEDYREQHWQSLFAMLSRRAWQVEIQRTMDDLACIITPIVESGVQIVIDHFGLPHGGINTDNPGHKKFLELLSTGNVWVKLSAIYRSEMTIEQAGAAFDILRTSYGGSLNKFLWGSDWPHTRFEESADYSSQYSFIRALVPLAAERKIILEDNPKTLFKFNEK